MLQPVIAADLLDIESLSSAHLLSYTDFAENEHYDFQDYQLIIVGITESRNGVSGNKNCDSAANEVRKEFYKMYAPQGSFRILDLGNLLPCETHEESQEQLNNLLNALIQKNIPVLLIGGTQDNSFGQYLAYEGREEGINFVNIDERIDLHELKSESMDSESYLWSVIMHHSHFLRKYTHLGYQQYYVPIKTVQALESLHFECVRIGELKTSIKKVEPFIRFADILSFDIGAIKSSDAPGKCNQSPNGFTGEEACQIMRYAGMSDKISSLGIYEFNPTYDLNKQTAMLISQMCWYFLEGILHRKPENPQDVNTEDDFRKYYVDNDEIGTQIVFYKSKKTDRWWMELPFRKNNLDEYELLACNYEDYRNALQGDMPERWLVAYHKFSHD